MVPAQHWARSFSVTDDDIEHIVNLLLDKETPLSSYQLAHILVEHRLNEEVAALEAEYKDAVVYNPARSVNVGQKLVFPVMDYSTAVVKAVRPGHNPEYGEFKVATVEFGDKKATREFAFDLTVPHRLSEEDGEFSGLNLSQVTADDILETEGDAIVDTLEQHLDDNTDLVNLAGKWFPRGLLLEVNEGHLNLAEAVLDINNGGPLTTKEILEQMGGLGKSNLKLQEFSINYALNKDPRFDEVGPSGEVFWYLVRMEPPGVQSPPALLRYTRIEHDPQLLTEEMLELEDDIADELSPLKPDTGINSGRVTLIYPHRRAGTLPLSANVRTLFPTAQTADRIWITLVDDADKEEFTGWVLPDERYVFGLGPLYAKYALPIGAHLTVRRSDEEGKVKIVLDTYKARAEWIPLMVPKGEGYTFETSKRAIGADYDDLMILGIDDLDAMDEIIAASRKQTVVSLMRQIIPGLSRLNPQGTAHVKTIYSALNVFRRCPPGPVMALLEANPDFEYVGDHYWKLAE